MSQSWVVASAGFLPSVTELWYSCALSILIRGPHLDIETQCDTHRWNWIGPGSCCPWTPTAPVVPQAHAKARGNRSLKKHKAEKRHDVSRLEFQSSHRVPIVLGGFGSRSWFWFMSCLLFVSSFLPCLPFDLLCCLSPLFYLFLM